MENKTAKKAGMAVCVAVMVIGIISLILYVGGFMPKIADLFTKEETTTQEAADNNQQAAFVSTVNGPADGMRAVRLEKDTDFTDITAAYGAVSDIADWGFNTVIFSGCDLAEAAQLATQAKNSGLFSVYMVDSAFVVKSGIADDAAAQSLCGVGVDSIMFYASQGITQSESALAAKTLRKYDDSLYIGVFAKAEKDYSTVCISDVFDYKYVDITVPSSKIAGDYTDYVSQYCDGTTKDTVFGLHAELVGNSEGYEKPQELMNQLMSATLAPSAGFGVYRYTVLSNNNGGLRDAVVDYMTNGIMKDYFRQLNMSKPEKTRFETNQSKVSFVGTGDISQPLKINGQAVEMIGDGYFSAERELKVGENKFVIEHKDKTLTYNITYKIKLIESVIPTGSVNASGGTILDVAVIAHKSASVTAALGGNSIKLIRSDEYDDSVAADDGSDYTYFVGQYVLPESGAADRNLGKIKIKASYSGISETVTGASVTVNKKEEFVPPVIVPVTTTEYITTVTEPPTVTDTPSENESSVVVSTTEKLTTTTTKKPETTYSQHIFEHLTPYKNNGVAGKSKMVVVKKDYAEALPGNTMNDVSVPYFTALLKGTVDYVVSSESYGSIKYYKLASGRRVYQSDVEYLSQGYNMPANEIRTVGVTKGADETKINLTMRWKVPFNVREHPQSFYTQISGRPYSVKSFTAEYVDVVFFHTSVTDSAPSVKTSVISKTQWIKNNDNSYTLRLYLNKKGGFYGIKYYYNNDGTLTLSIKERPNSAISGKVIMLDPGHGGNDPGAIGVAVVGNKRVYEETINMAIANKVKSRLEALGATVIMTRTNSNKTIDLDTRAALCRATNPDVFVAIHCDASESSSASGATAYYYKSYSYPLANSLSRSIVSAYKNKIYADNSSMAAKVDKGSIFKGFRVTRVEECPAVLIESGFVTNVVECNALVKDSNQSILAQAMVDGLVNYFKNS